MLARLQAWSNTACSSISLCLGSESGYLVYSVLFTPKPYTVLQSNKRVILNEATR